MKAWQIQRYGSTEVFEQKILPDPAPKEGWVLIEVKAFGLNRSELYTRQGHSGEAVTLPRVLGIECVGVVVDGGGTDLQPGQKVAAAMGDMGRKYDGGYASMTLIPRSNVFAVETALDSTTFGALPEMYLTAWGVVMDAIGLQPGQSLLIRGGTSSVGLACTSIAKAMGCTVLATTRKPKKAHYLTQAGVDHVLIDDGEVEHQVKALIPEGVNGVVELVGLEHTILDCLQSCAPQGTVCMVGFLGNSWDYAFFPWMPSTVKLTQYSSETIQSDKQTTVLQTVVDRVSSGMYTPHIFKAFEFDQLPEAHNMMEENRAAGKLVVTV